MKLFNSTKRWVRWWSRRKINWREHYMNPEHPHRRLIIEVLNSFPWFSLIELGCGAGANLVNVVKYLSGRQVGGVDINPDAIEFCNKHFTSGLFKVASADNVLLSDKMADVLLVDMLYIYISPFKIKKYLKELKRLTRTYVVLCELHDQSLWNRLALKWNEGLNAYDWEKLLAKHGFYDIMVFKISPEGWPDSTLQQRFGHIVVAKVPKDYH